MSRIDHQTLVDSLVRDSGGSIAPLERDRAIDAAVLRYSQDVPREVVEDVTWTQQGYEGPIPAGWAGSIQLTTIDYEYPIGRQPRALIDASLYWSPSGLQIRTSAPLEAGSVVRVRYATSHLVTDSADTIPPKHCQAVASFAASILCLQLATLYAGERDASIGADASNTDSRTRNYRQMSRDYRAAYYSGIGHVDPEKAGSGAGATGIAPAASASGWAGRQRYGFRSNDTGYGRA